MIRLIPMLFAVIPQAGSEFPLPQTLDLQVVRALFTQQDGRWPPLDTVARSTVEKITGNPFYRGHDPVLMLLGWTFDPKVWERQPLITISNAELRAELELSNTQTVYSYVELMGHERLMSLIDHLAHVEEGHKPNPLESKVADIREKLVVLQQAFSGRTIWLIPDPDSYTGAWKPIKPTRGGQTEGVETVQAAWSSLKKAFLGDDAESFASASKELTTALAALPAAHRPDPKLIATELRYNSLRPFRTAWIVMLGGALLATTALFVRRKWFDLLSVLGMLAGFVLLSFGLWLRWQIAGRIPASNMFESLLFLSWGMGAFAILSMLVMRNRAVPLTATLMGAVALLLADVLPLNPYIRPIVPVLMDTIWMSIHVPIIMVSYSVLALAMLIAHVQLGVMAFAPSKRALVAQIDRFHYWHIHVGSVLLLAGIITGSMWGASSWGRYWGWDPKEVWSLIAFLGYLTILHVRVNRERIPWWAYVIGFLMAGALFAIVIPKLAPISPTKGLALAGTAATMVLFLTARGMLAAALKSVLCFWLIVMTYVGVNYVLGIGLHSYGFGTGAVARYMLMTGSIDLGLALLLCLIYLARRVMGPPTETGIPATA